MAKLSGVSRSGSSLMKEFGSSCGVRAALGLGSEARDRLVSRRSLPMAVFSCPQQSS